ncbi:MAG: glycosyltransferase, partial [Alphaproteobacteria bacterium]|nr:glycosyltransferase [Alphaproteobacteria bacterium]
KYVNYIEAFVATCKTSAMGIRQFHKYQNKIHLIGHFIKKPIVTKIKPIINSVGCVARLSPEKGIDFLLGAWQLVIKKIPDATLHIYGHGPDENHLRELSRALNIEKNVYFCGTFSPKTGIGSIAGRHKVFIQPSLFESIPTSLIELMGCNRAIIATDAGGIKEVINKNTGILLKDISLEKMANAIVHLLQNPNLQYQYAKNAQQLFNTKYSLKINIAKVISLYKSVISNHNARHQKLEQLLRKIDCISQDETLLLIDASNGKLPEKFDFDTYYTFYKLFELVILPEVLKISPITLSGYHGIEHTKTVGRFALDLSIALNQNPIPALFAAALHDCARKHNYYDEEHALNAIPVAKKLFTKDIALLLNKKEQHQVIEAVRNHTVGKNATDIISGILWDSDRIRLSWDRTYQPEFFSTAPGRKIASLSPIKRTPILKKHKRLCDKLNTEIAKKKIH